VYNGNQIFQTRIFAHATSSLTGANISGPTSGNNLLLFFDSFCSIVYSYQIKKQWPLVQQRRQ